MNTKFSFALLMIVVGVIVNACTPAIEDSSTPVVPVAQYANRELSAVMAVISGSAATTAREAQEPRLWSGEVFLSDNGNPDLVQHAKPAASQKTEGTCMSADSLPRRHGGCVE